MAVEINNSNKDTYFTFSGFHASANQTYILTENISLNSNVYMRLTSGTVFNGDGYTIDMTGITFSGLFTTGGSSLETGSVIKNVGVKE